MSKDMANQTLSREEKMLRGTAWSSLSDFISRLFGAFYIIPWYIWMGQAAPKANALFGMGYNIYGYFLLISTAGLNVAVAKQIAKYNAIGQEARSIQLIRSFMRLMTLAGLLSAAVLYLGAPFFAASSGGAEGLVTVIRSLTLAVLVFPAMSVFRGVFQGYNNIKPSAISQMAEQLIRVIWMLLTTYMVMKVGSKDYVTAVAQSTFAAFVGMIASMAVLVYYFWKEGHLAKLLAKDLAAQETTADSLNLLKETVKESVPILVTGSAIQAYQIIDQMTFINAMASMTQASKDQLTILYSYLSANPNKIIMIIVAIAASIGGVGIALLTESFMQKDKEGTARLILNNFQMLLVFILPALMGAIIMARPLYTVFYGPSDSLAIGLFIAILGQTLLQCLYVVLAPMLHAIFESKKAVLYFVYGLVVKLLTQWPTLYLFKAYGPIISTALGLLVPILLMYIHLQRITRFNPRVWVKNALLISFNTLLMAVPVLLVAIGLKWVYPATGYVSSAVHLLAGGGLGILVYGYLSLKSRSIDKLLGARADSLRRVFKIS